MTEHEKKIEELTELLRCVRVARDLYRSETYSLKERIAELEEENDQLSDDNVNLSAMHRSAYRRMFDLERAERERQQLAA